ncbi:acyl-protein thioesterase [Diaporthe helianthi]|uniref:Acyl-protein thioesterase n=1 Tax=Diaporthe helianthi TaxID=158607 RepID=A0A2P5HG56_DIAHE|nr:acyl-protein thioesterase [Diaporthe helianthi]
MPVEYTFPEPLTYEPTSGVHKQTIILLHGRGGSADAFGPALLSTALPIADTETSTPGASPHTKRRDLPAVDPVSGKYCNPSGGTTLAQALPHARFVFPTAPKQRATVYKRSVIRQWFDDWHLGFVGDEVDGRYDLGLQTSGMGRTVAYLHDLIAEEAEVVGGGARNIILGGISQGCAVSLVASLLWAGEDGLGGVVGMCGWLPYIDQIRGYLCVEGDDEEKPVTVSGLGEDTGFDPFERPASPGCDAGGSVAAAVEWLRDEIEVPSRRSVTGDVRGSGSTPAIMCHGRDDGKVDIAKGKEAADFLPALGVGPVRFKAYAGVEHEFSADMLLDIVEFVQRVLEEPHS